VTAPQATEDVVAPPPTVPARLNRPGRALVALAELIVAGAAVWAAFWAWPRGFATITTVIADGTALDSQRVYGNWLAAAIGFGTIAALLVVDATRQLLLAVRTRPRRARRGKAAAATPDTASDSTTDTTSDTTDAAPVTASDTRVSGDD
jgi:hypothetical protein